VSARRIRSQRILTIHVRDPELFVKRGGLLNRLGRRMSCKFYDGPIQISAVCLETDFDSLAAAVQKYFAKYACE
jgi:hypothetical protein